MGQAGGGLLQGLRRTQSEDETVALGRLMGEYAQPATWLTLAGPLGSGKTVLARGVLAGLGYAGRVRSPTYGLIHAYEEGQTRLPAYHLDLYRLAAAAEIWDLGLTDLLEEDVVVIMEWADRLECLPAAACLQVRLSFGDAPDQRCLGLTASQEPARQLLKALLERGEVAPC